MKEKESKKVKRVYVSPSTQVVAADPSPLRNSSLVSLKPNDTNLEAF